MDYYDYNVVNAGAAPGSYLGMDPAFLVWIPPLDEDGEILPEQEHEMDDIKPKVYIDPGSNKESPEEEMTLLPKIKKNTPLMKKRIHPIETGGGIEKEPLVSVQFHRNKMEKETKVEKSPSIDSNILMADIKFVDEDEDEIDEKIVGENVCNNIELSYQDSNILSSS